MKCFLNVQMTCEIKMTTAQEHERELRRTIEARAHELFCRRGRAHGSDREDWLAAEQDVLSNNGRVVRTEADRGLIVRVELAAVQPGTVLLSVSSASLLVYYPEVEGFHLEVISFPRPIDPQTTVAAFEEGRLIVSFDWAAN